MSQVEFAIVLSLSLLALQMLIYCFLDMNSGPTFLEIDRRAEALSSEKRHKQIVCIVISRPISPSNN